MLDFTKARWIFEPKRHQVTDESVTITTDPGTDFWQRSYYGFKNDNAPALLLDSNRNFTFTAKVSFDYQSQFDQCGLIIYLDSENWFKASIEFENQRYSRLGSVVTNLGYSDWATVDIALPRSIWYRLSRRGPDFLVESSLDGIVFKQMRVFHLHRLGKTTAEMGKANPPLATKRAVSFGVYACSPSQSSFEACFSDMTLAECVWQAHGS
ncbi:DUF1349 domain-containing protein [Alginatibacterium sediminis]|uniref:DUF1349 domain-containing protein n=1 Tax=Alginatibacterium sediminis TaxID=2164068 RepID=A0A420E9S4_9ALTE|nr:DUF1349 domain-containing protein [Alginatibacterium sediminis]RKF17427.1 DUF1349 domain-containing protein [Alginatibacterium sediminis]